MQNEMKSYHEIRWHGMDMFKKRTRKSGWKMHRLWSGV